VVSVALFRPVCWMACRSARFLTALVLMALLLGGHAAGFTPAGVAEAVGAGPRATTDLSTMSGLSSPPRQEPSSAGVDSADLPASDAWLAAAGRAAVGAYPSIDAPTDAAARLAAADDEAQSTPGAEPSAFGVRPEAPGGLPGTGPRTWPAGDAYPRTSGTRAPPLG
jgi:hypothetical protein